LNKNRQDTHEGKLLRGIETKIDREGNLDVSNRILKDLDVVTASIDSGFKQPKES